LRKRFAIGSLSIGIPILIYLLYHHGANYIVILLITLSLIPSFLAALSDSLLEVTPKLHQDVNSLQKNGLIVGVARFLFTLALFISPFTFVAILANGIPRLYGNMQLKKISNKYILPGQKPDPEIKKNILKVVSRILPGAIYYCVSGQITVFLLSFFGNTASIGQVGALGRLAMILNVFTVVFGTIIVPRFARLPDDKKLLLRSYILLQLGFIMISFILICLVWLFPSQILWVLGKKYVDLGNVLLLSILGSCLGLIAGSSFTLSTCRGWAINPVISISITIISIIGGIFIIDISSLKGVLKFNILILSIETIMYVIYCLMKINSQATKVSY